MGDRLQMFHFDILTLFISGPDLHRARARLASPKYMHAVGVTLGHRMGAFPAAHIRGMSPYQQVHCTVAHFWEAEINVRFGIDVFTGD